MVVCLQYMVICMLFMVVCVHCMVVYTQYMDGLLKVWACCVQFGKQRLMRCEFELTPLEPASMGIGDVSELNLGSAHRRGDYRRDLKRSVWAPLVPGSFPTDETERFPECLQFPHLDSDSSSSQNSTQPACCHLPVKS